MGDYCVREELTKEAILSRVSPYDIFRHYIPWYVPNRTILTPFVNETRPSFWSVVRQDGSIWFKDFGRGYSGDCFTLVQILNGGCDFPTALRHINVDMGLDLEGSSIKPGSVKFVPSTDAPVAPETVISCSLRDFNEEDLIYWGLHGISYHTLITYRVAPIDYYWVNEYYFRAQPKAYRWPVQDQVKIYQPYHPDPQYKWSGCVGSQNVQGHDQLPQRYHTLILQSSLKDAMACLDLLQIPGVSASSETTPLPKDFLDEYERRFDRICILFDSDDAGQKHAQELTDSRKYENLVLPFSTKEFKDPSGMIFNGKRETLVEFFRSHHLFNTI